MDSPQPKTGTGSILIVDDVKANVDMLVEALHDEYKLSVALDGGNALKQAEKNPPDLVLLDIVMPVTFVLGAALLAASVWLFLRWWNDHLDPTLLLAWCGFVIYFLHPWGKSYEQIDYLLPLVVWACQLQKSRSPARLFFWLGSLVLSWAAFFVSSQAGAPPSTGEWPLFFNAIWLAWLFWRRPAANLAAAPQA